MRKYVCSVQVMLSADYMRFPDSQRGPLRYVLTQECPGRILMSVCLSFCLSVSDVMHVYMCRCISAGGYVRVSDVCLNTYSHRVSVSVCLCVCCTHDMCRLPKKHFETRF
jgi:hypothetical protein